MNIADLKPIAWQLKEEPLVAITKLSDGNFYVRAGSYLISKDYQFDVVRSESSRHKTPEEALAFYEEFCKTFPDSFFS